MPLLTRSPHLACCALALLLAACAGTVAGSASAPTPTDGLGLSLEREGTALRVAAVDPRLPAHEAGLRVGDELVSIDGVELENDSIEQVTARLQAPRADAIRMVVRRSGGGRQELFIRRPRPAPAKAPQRGAVAKGPQSAGRSEVISQAAVKVGDPYIDFTLPRLGGGQVTLSELIGKPVFIDFWATWCAPCRAEAPALAAIHKRFGDSIHMLGVSLDFEPLEPMGYAREHGLTYPHLFTAGGWRDAVVQQYGIHKTGIPFNLLLDSSGRIAAMDLHGEPLAQALELLTGGADSRP